MTQIKHPKRIFMVGRLDKDTTGLLLLTDDGRLVNALLRSEHSHRKTYLVRVDRPLSVAPLRALRRGVTITTYAQRDGNSKSLTAPTLPAEVQQVGLQPSSTYLLLVLFRNIRIFTAQHMSESVTLMCLYASCGQLEQLCAQ